MAGLVEDEEEEGEGVSLSFKDSLQLAQADFALFATQCSAMSALVLSLCAVVLALSEASL